MTQLLKNPLTRLFAVYVIGTFVANKTPLFTDIIFLFALLISTFLLYLFLFSILYKKYSFRWWSGSLTLFFLLFFSFFNFWYNAPKKEYLEREVAENGVVTQMKIGQSGWSQITFKPLKGSKKPQSEKWLLNVKNELIDEIEENCIYSVKGKLLPLVSTKTVTSFDYNKYLYNNGYSGQLYISDLSSIKLLQKSDDFKLSHFPKKVNHYCAQKYSASGLNSVSQSIIKALLLGDRTEIDKEVNQQFIKSGVVHILAVSGLHVGIIYMILNGVLSLFFTKKSHFKWIAVVIMLVGYAFITGFSPSVSRAVLMFSIIQIGQAMQQQLNMYYLVILSAFILLIIQPFFIFNAGFWLSHLAVVGIVAFFPMFNKILKFKFPVWKGAWSIVCVSASAQLGTMPFSFYLFGTFPTYFLLANILILPVVAPLLILSILLLLFSFSSFVSAMIAGVIDDIVSFMISITKWINLLPYSYFDLIWVSLLLMLTLYLLIFYFSQTYLTPNSKNISMSLLFCLTAILILNFQFFEKINSNNLIIYDLRQGFMIDVFHKGRVITIESDEVLEKTKSLYRNGLVKELMVKQDTILKLSNEKPQIKKVNFNGQKYFIIHGFNEKYMPIIKETDIDGLFISRNKNYDFLQSIDFSDSSVVITSHDIPFYERLNIENISKGLNYSLYSLRSEGTKIISK